MRPVQFPAAAAGEAQEVCERVAALLDGHLTARPGMVEGARDGWEGTYRDEFDDTWTVQETRLVGLREDLVRLGARLAAAAEAAVTIDGQRATARSEYLSQQATLSTGAN
jgi:hypothetical protein